MSESQHPRVAAEPPPLDETTPESPAEAPEALPAAVPGDEIDAVRAERDEYYDLLLRKTAEFDNYRKRTDRERREAGDRATAAFITELLPVVDDLERATRTEAGEAGAEAYRAGVALIVRRLAEVLASHGVEPIDPLGEDFDPHRHEAVVRVQSAAHRDGEIVEVLGKGYRMGERLLRPAMVKVATS